jgi:prepilin-type processing-associated H-X9-DG protein
VSAPFSFHPVARIELNEAAAYYEAEHHGLGLRFVDSIGSAIQQVREHPESCQVVHDRSRRKLVDGFPYSVIYSFVDGHVRVQAIAHSRRRPFYWSGRS